MTTINESFANNLESFESDYAQYDRGTVEILKERIFDYARHGSPVSYSQLVSGITFNINGNKHIIDTHRWSGLDRRIVGDYLFQIMKDQYRKLGILSTMIVFSQDSQEPSQIVQDWLKDIGAYTGDWLEFWSKETAKVVEYYKRQSIDNK
jgi:hypothetical protein